MIIRKEGVVGQGRCLVAAVTHRDAVPGHRIGLAHPRRRRTRPRNPQSPGPAAASTGWRAGPGSCSAALPLRFGPRRGLDCGDGSSPSPMYHSRLESPAAPACACGSLRDLDCGHGSSPAPEVHSRLESPAAPPCGFGLRLDFGDRLSRPSLFFTPPTVCYHSDILHAAPLP